MRGEKIGKFYFRIETVIFNTRIYLKFVEYREFVTLPYQGHTQEALDRNKSFVIFVCTLSKRHVDMNGKK